MGTLGAPRIALAVFAVLALAGCASKAAGGSRQTPAQLRLPSPSGHDNWDAQAPRPVRCAGLPESVSVSSPDALRRALAAAVPGQAIILEPGVYQGEFVATASGSPQHPITLCGERDAVLEDQSVAQGYALHLDRASWWRLEDLTLQRAQKGVVLDDASHDLLYDLSVHTIGDEAIHLRSFSSDDIISHDLIRATGLHRSFFGEGVYVGSAHKNWCRYSACQPDASDHDLIIANDIADTTAENIDIKEGTSSGLIADNRLAAIGMVATAASASINVKGNNWTIEGNTATNGLKDGLSVHQVYPGWGLDNAFYDNRMTLNAPGYGIYVQSQHLGTVVACDNTVTGANQGLSDIPCSTSKP